MSYLKTEVITYSTEKAMRNDIAARERIGWKVINVQSVNQGYAPGKTCCLGLLFLPLALLGKRRDKYQVTYQHDAKTLSERINEVKDIFTKDEPPTKPSH